MVRFLLHEQLVPLSIKLKWYYIIAVGAKNVGHAKISEEAFSLATQIERQIYDQIDEEVANALAFSSYYYISM